MSDKSPGLPPVEEENLHEAARGLPTGYSMFRTHVSQAEIHELAPEENEPIPEDKATKMPRLFAAVEEIRQEWRPYMKPALRLAPET